MTDSTVIVISGTTYEITKTVKLAEYGNPKRGTDNAAYDPSTHLFYPAVEVFGDQGTNENTSPLGTRFNGGDNHQPSGASIDIIDTGSATLVGSIQLPGGDPAGVALEPSGKRLYVAWEILSEAIATSRSLI
jgi:DNA-binding beta-propeller fold protein YncE